MLLQIVWIPRDARQARHRRSQTRPSRRSPENPAERISGTDDPAHATPAQGQAGVGRLHAIRWSIAVHACETLPVITIPLKAAAPISDGGSSARTVRNLADEDQQRQSVSV